MSVKKKKSQLNFFAVDFLFSHRLYRFWFDTWYCL